jgi:hypothetical protein
VATRNWRNRDDQTAPAVFETIAKMGPGAVFVLALGATLLNPKNLILLLSAGTQTGARQSPRWRRQMSSGVEVPAMADYEPQRRPNFLPGSVPLGQDLDGDLLVSR